ncbi:Ig-like domain-containing protein [Konateibacter massiliensis]|uniref:Ig-like domain-containing protein n=1 Tax=Konateibacter massiliensis TaxID=2002841 RepID=UPI001F25DCED|nr:Ig-like domain-containing protein [Konateibacter massiliensis]
MKRLSLKRFMLALSLSLAMALAVPSALPAVTSVTTVEAAVKLNKTSATILTGKTVKLKVKGSSAKKKVTWKSSNTKVATVSSTGVVTGIKSGTVKISAKVSGKTYKCTVKVKTNQFKQSAPSLKSLESGYIHFYPMKVYYKNGQLHYTARVYNRKPFRISSISNVKLAVTVPDGSDEGLIIAEKTFTDLSALTQDSTGATVMINPGKYVTYDFVFSGSNVLVKNYDLTSIKKIYYVAQYDFN